MTGKKRLIEFVFVVLLVLVLSAFRTVTARADDATPPPTATPEVTQPAGDGSGEGTQVAPTDAATPVPTEATVTQAADTSTPVDVNTATPVSTDETVTQAAEPSTPVDTSSATPAPTQASGDAGSTSTDATALLISQIPQGSQLVLLSDQQPAIPLGSAEAANIIATGDPIWCPTGVTPKANTGGCTDTFGLFNGGLLNHLRNKTTSGTIWIETSYSEGAAVTLDKNDLVNIGTTANYALTLQGGWNGIQGTKTISGSSTFGYPLTIAWNADVTLNDITVTGVANIGPALYVTTPKNITLTGVNVNNNHGGADLDNRSGTGNVTVTSSQFNKNVGGNGLTIESKGTITLSNVMAENNGGDGAYLFNSTAPSPMNVTLISSPYEFNGNGEFGLEIYSKGAIALKDIDALGNAYDGVDLDDTSATTAETVTLAGSNVFSENGVMGMEAYSNGAISANNVVANANGNWGLKLDNHTATLAQPVTLTGSSNQFNSNAFGLTIYSKGNITLNSITASYNWGDPGSGFPYPPSGAYLDDCVIAGPKCTGAGNVTLTGTNSFEDNYRSGIWALSGGTITISNLSADGNSQGHGAYLFNASATTPKSVTLTGTNSFSNNLHDGLYVESLGAVAVNNVTANHNDGIGVYVDDIQTGAVGSLTLSGINTFNDNGYGLDAYSNGAISLNSLDVENNSGMGARIDNSAASSPKSVNLSGTNVFNGNGGDGLFVISKGMVTLNSMDAESNGQLQQNPAGTPPLEGYGVYVVNDLTPASHQNVTLTGTNSFYNNWFGGLAVDSYGTITTNNITADENGQIGQGGGYNGGGYDGWGGYADWADGVYLDNCLYSVSACSNPAPESISVNGNNQIDSNQGLGLKVDSSGAISVSDVMADTNSEDGADLLNNSAASAMNVTLTSGPFQFNGNWIKGLRIVSKGAIALKDIDALDNIIGAGVILNNTSATTAQGITLAGSNVFSGNGSVGLEAISNGTISANNLVANTNNGGGAMLENNGATSAQPVILTGSNQFDSNFIGLYIYSKGNITLNSITASYNWGDFGSGKPSGAYLDNCRYNGSKCTGTGNVTLTGTNSFEDNYRTGLTISSMDTITINNLSADGNGHDKVTPANSAGYGADLENVWATTPKSLTLTGTNSFSNNYNIGLYVVSLGAVAVNNVTANNNQIGPGADLYALVSLTFNGINTFDANGLNGGLVAQSRGAISLNSLDAEDNLGSGAQIDNFSASTPQSVNLKGTNIFYKNAADGVDVNSKGAISLNSLDAEDNLGSGAQIDNSSASTPQSVNLKGTNIFNGNATDGVDVNSKGAITINGTWEANGNHYIGTQLNNTNPGSAGNVSVALNYSTYGGFSGNGQHGLVIGSLGSISVSNLAADSNGGTGVTLNNDPAATPQSVALSGSTDVNDNGNDGLDVYSKGAITISGTWEANGNHDTGTELDNTTPGSTGNVNVTINHSTDGGFSGNGEDGLNITSLGAIAVSNLVANNNGGSGAYLDNKYAGTSQSVTLSGTNNFSNNHIDGLYFQSYNNVTVNNVTANGNGRIGVNGIYDKSITVLGGSMTSNTSYGWQFDASMTITLKGVFAYGNNGGHGDTNLLGGTLVIVRTYP